jgi:dTDP-4-dehydrorhamnose reductase
VGDVYFDQLERSGHDARIEDLAQLAATGVRALRYPVLWERTAPDGVARADWRWADERLERLRALGIRPIVGLVHHGSGPRHTSLLDADFAAKLAEYAGAVAARYPWVDAYTPVNEPLTTARFSGLYGHWYPHGRDDLTFARALINQCRAVVLSMRAIRAVNPAAQLVQTDDLGKTHSTRMLRYQADFENERRWLTFDLLCGRVDATHPLWGYFRAAGISADELAWFTHNVCPPDIIGLNYYVTSERFLDERLERYPLHTHGGNRRHIYADVEAVRVLAEGLTGPRRLLHEAWARYGLPLAVTEAHLGCTREEQMRWFKQVWDVACGLRSEGVDMRAVTAWAMLGIFDWDHVVTCANGYYEPGVFDLRAPRPRPTALAPMLRALADGTNYQHPVLAAPGWWQRLDRLLYLPQHERPLAATPAQQVARPATGQAPRPLLITGATGTLGYAFGQLCHTRGLPYHLLTRRQLEITDSAAIEAALVEFKPWAVVNTAGYVRVDDAEREPDACRRANADGPALLAAACARHDAALLTFSSDLVFDGLKQAPYVEGDAVCPLNVYGATKAEAEQRVLAALPTALVIRTSAFFGPWDEYNFITVLLETLAAGRPFLAASDAVVSPTYVPDLVNASLDLLIDGECGIWHLANQGALTWAELARQAAERAQLNKGLIKARPTASLSLAAARPRYSVLGSERGTLLPPLVNAIERYFAERWHKRQKSKLYLRARAGAL